MSEPPSDGNPQSLDALLDLAADGVVITDAEGRVRRANVATRRFTGEDPETAVGRALGELLLDKLGTGPLQVPFSSPEEIRGWRVLFAFRDEESALGSGECTITALLAGDGPTTTTTGYLVLLQDVTRSSPPRPTRRCCSPARRGRARA